MDAKSQKKQDPSRASNGWEKTEAENAYTSFFLIEVAYRSAEMN